MKLATPMYHATHLEGLHIRDLVRTLAYFHGDMHLVTEVNAAL
jgi:hypothetical protein